MKKTSKQSRTMNQKKTYLEEKAYLKLQIRFLTLISLFFKLKAAINNFNENLLENSETINYVDDIHLDDVKDNNNLEISASKISEKYRKLRKRKATESEKQIKVIIEEFKLPKKRKKQQTNKAVLLVAKNISKKVQKH